MNMFKNLLRKPRKIFIDCGGNNGCSVRKFRTTIDLASEYEIFSFEPNPEFARNYWDFTKHNLLPFAVWIEYGEQDFFLDREDGDGSTLIKEKLTRESGGVGQLDKEKPLKVTTIDLSSWIRRNFCSHDEILLKLDIEGAEYKVLEKLFADGTISYIKKILIEWHWQKIGVPEAEHKAIVERLRAARIPVSEWDAQKF